jgi:hypothetical protein
LVIVVVVFVEQLELIASGRRRRVLVRLRPGLRDDLGPMRGMRAEDAVIVE